MSRVRSIRTRSWEKDGVTRYTTEIIGEEMTMLSTQKVSKPSHDDLPI